MLTLKKSKEKVFNFKCIHHADCLNLHLQAAQKSENAEDIWLYLPVICT